GANLAGQVHFDFRVDVHHTIVQLDAEWVVGVRRGMKFEDGVFVEKVEQLSGAQHKTQNDLARLEVLALPVDHSRLDQRNRAVGEHFGVHAQVFAVHQVGQDCVWNA